MAKLPHCPRFIVAGPDFVTVSTGADRLGGNVNCPTRFAVFTRPSLVINSATGLPLLSTKLMDNV